MTLIKSRTSKARRVQFLTLNLITTQIFILIRNKNTIFFWDGEKRANHQSSSHNTLTHIHEEEIKILAIVRYDVRLPFFTPHRNRPTNQAREVFLIPTELSY